MYQPAALKSIVVFLTGCLDEDERLAVCATGSMNFATDPPSLLPSSKTQWETGPREVLIAGLPYGEPGTKLCGLSRQDVADHIARHDPAAVLADIAAKRALVALHGDYYEDPCLKLEDGAAWEPEQCEPCLTLRWVASGYKRREGFKESWRLG